MEIKYLCFGNILREFKIKIYKNFCILSLDKKPGGISNMIESSTEALALRSDYVNIFLPDSFYMIKIFKQVLNIKNLNINKINFLDKSFF